MNIRRILARAFRGKNLFYTNVFLSITISCTGDSIAQTYELHREYIDRFYPDRTVHMGFSGAMAGLICHHWYKFLDNFIVGNTLTMLVKKLLLDQFINSPIVILSFFGTVALFEDSPMRSFNYYYEVKHKFWTLYKAEWVVWPPAQIVNFYFLPTKYRVLYDNCVSLGYDIFTSYVKHN